MSEQVCVPVNTDSQEQAAGLDLTGGRGLLLPLTWKDTSHSASLTFGAERCGHCTHCITLNEDSTFFGGGRLLIHYFCHLTQGPALDLGLLPACAM